MPKSHVSCPLTRGFFEAAWHHFTEVGDTSRSVDLLKSIGKSCDKYVEEAIPDRLDIMLTAIWYFHKTRYANVVRMPFNAYPYVALTNSGVGALLDRLYIEKAEVELRGKAFPAHRIEKLDRLLDLYRLRDIQLIKTNIDDLHELGYRGFLAIPSNTSRDRIPVDWGIGILRLMLGRDPDDSVCKVMAKTPPYNWGDTL